MKIHLTAKPIFNFEMTPDMLAAFTKASEAHYDHICIAASARNGFLSGIGGRLWAAAQYEEIDSTVAISGYDLETLLKICENTACLQEDQIVLVRQFVKAALLAIRHAGERFGTLRYDVPDAEANSILIPPSDRSSWKLI